MTLMNIRLFSLLLFLAGCLSVARGIEPPPLVEGGWHGKPLTLGEAARNDLRSQAVQLVESSNFYTTTDGVFPTYTLPGAVFWVQKEYRETVAGSYVVFNFPEPRKIKTLRDEITVTRRVIGLNRDNYASSLFTIDGQGSVVGHGKYRGDYCIEFLRALKKDVQDNADPAPSPQG